MFAKFQKLFNRQDFRENPFSSIWKRLWWRIHWQITDRPLKISFADTLKILIPNSGSGAGIYYQGFSEPDTADFFIRFLRSGMEVIDVGAHIGEYTLLAAKIVGKSGRVHAFEPQSHLFEVLQQSVQLDNLDRVVLNCSAVSDRTGNVEFQVCTEPALSSIKKQNTTQQSNDIISVPCISLDKYCADRLDNIDLIKIDVEGAEKFIFQGASRLLALPLEQAPTWIFEYAPNSYIDFDYEAAEILQLLARYNYQIFRYAGAGRLEAFNPQSQLSDITNLVATKDPATLLDRIADRDRVAAALQPDLQSRSQGVK